MLTESRALRVTKIINELKLLKDLGNIIINEVIESDVTNNTNESINLFWVDLGNIIDNLPNEADTSGILSTCEEVLK